MRRRYSSPRGRVCTGFGWSGSGTPQARRSRNRSVQHTRLPSDTFLTPHESPPDGFTSIIIGHASRAVRSEEHTSELQSRLHLVCRLLLEKKKKQDVKNY